MSRHPCLYGRIGSLWRKYAEQKPDSLRLMLRHSPRHITIDASGAEPSIIVGLQLDDVTAVLVGAAVVGRKQIDEFAGASITANGSAIEHDSARFAGEVVQCDQRVVVPLVAHDEHTGLIGLKNFPITPANLRTLPSHSDLAFHPVEH